MLFALAYVVLTLFGLASERLGFDRTIRANTEVRRTHSLFQQGLSLFGWLRREIAKSLFDTASRAFNVLTQEGACVAIS